MGRRLRAIDLYSGVGGWALGLRMAGIEVVASYEKWADANTTNLKNNGHQTFSADIRKLELRLLPKNIDIVVGSPPCVEFSYSNRGGGGDIVDGLRDVIKFLTVVDHLKPKLWAMENVPRLAEILDRELTSKGRLSRFRHLRVQHDIVNTEDFGLPQRRIRCLAGNFDFKLLKSYAANAQRPTLGTVIEALAGPTVVDPIYALEAPHSTVPDHNVEDYLDSEEERINRAAKSLHTIYNKMAFPDRLDRSVRTITATCTRVSRESIIVEDLAVPGRYRRLTLRERSTLQGFPITFNFYGTSYGLKMAMIGNATPPLLSFYIGQAFRRIPVTKALIPAKAIKTFRAPTEAPVATPPRRSPKRFLKNRTFCFAIPTLHFKSGVRFELGNEFRDGGACWRVAFIFGTSKSIHDMSLTPELLDAVINQLPMRARGSVRQVLGRCHAWIKAADVLRMQDVWSHQGPGLTRPFMLLDHLNEFAEELKCVLANAALDGAPVLEAVISGTFKRKAKKLAGLGKLRNNANAVLVGLLVGAAANIELEAHRRKQLPAPANSPPGLVRAARR